MVRISQKNPVWFAPLSYKFLDVNNPLPSKLSALHIGRTPKCPFSFSIQYSLLPKTYFLIWQQYPILLLLQLLTTQYVPVIVLYSLPDV